MNLSQVHLPKQVERALLSPGLKIEKVKCLTQVETRVFTFSPHHFPAKSIIPSHGFGAIDFAKAGKEKEAEASQHRQGGGPGAGGRGEEGKGPQTKRQHSASGPTCPISRAAAYNPTG